MRADPGRRGIWTESYRQNNIWVSKRVSSEELGSIKMCLALYGFTSFMTTHAGIMIMILIVNSDKNI